MKNGVTNVGENAVKLNLQYFSEATGENEGGVAGSVMGDLGTENEVEIDVNQEELNIQKGLSEEDVEARVQAEREKWLAEIEEENRMAKLSADEREKEERIKKDKEIEALKQQILSKDLKEKATMDLRKSELPIELTELLDYTSKENMEKGLLKVKDIFTKSVESEVLKRLKGGVPKGLGGVNNAQIQVSMAKKIEESIRGGL